jgi:hypothetical protein
MGRQNPDDGTIVSQSDRTHSRKSFASNGKENVYARGMARAKACRASSVIL